MPQLRPQRIPGRRVTALAAVLLAAGAFGQGGPARESTVRLIVIEATPATTAAEDVVERVGGRVTASLRIIGGFAADVPAGAVAALEQSPSVEAVRPDAPISMADLDDGHDDDDDGVFGDDDDDDDGEDPFEDLLEEMAEYDHQPANLVWQDAIGLPLPSAGIDGEGVTVAVLDTGVTEVADLGDRVLARVDLTPNHDGLDRYGHGTHIAGVIGGDGSASGGTWRGVAPGADLVSVKVASTDGSTDVSAVIAGLQWVVEHRDVYDIRVLNLSFGTDATQTYLTDPLNYAIEQAWNAGILVVVSAGNRGPGAGSISKPGDDPFVLTVGAADVGGTSDPADDRVAPFSAQGPTADGIAKPDLVAPGITIVSSRAAGSTIDLARPAARVDTAYFKGTGTSQAAAIVSGVAALLFQADPSLSPDEAKAILVGTANPRLAGQPGAGSGLIDVTAALALVGPGEDVTPANQGLAPAAGTGSLEGSRGSFRVYADLDGDGIPEPVHGEIDVLGHPWLAAAWPADAWRTSPWARLAARWEGWTIGEWIGETWGGMAWGNKAWEQKAWEQKAWENSGWAAGSWN